MARYRLTLVSEKNHEVPSMRKKIEALFPGMTVLVEREKPNPTKRDRFEGAQELFEDAKSEVEALKDEMQEWYDSMPDQFKDGDKGAAVQEAADALDNLVSELEGVDFGSVEFPS